MYSRQIEAVLKLDLATKHAFNGVYSMDKLPESCKSGAYVINLDDHDEPGSHWVAVWKEGPLAEYMDSYGQPPLDIRCINFLGSNCLYNTFSLQQQLSNGCGFYCVYFIIQRARGQPANVILDMLSRVDSGFVVKNFIYSRYKPIFN